MTGKNWVQLLVLSLLWGGSFFFVEVALEGLPVLTIVWCRVALGALFLALAIGYATQHRGFGHGTGRSRAVEALLFSGGLAATLHRVVLHGDRPAPAPADRDRDGAAKNRQGRFVRPGEARRLPGVVVFP